MTSPTSPHTDTLAADAAREPQTLPFRVKAILSDMDGTLVDSTALVEAMWHDFAVTLGLDPDEVIDYAHGRPSRATIGKYAPDAVEYWLDYIHDAEHKHFNEVVEIPGAAAFASSLPREKWALVTSALTAPARERIEIVGVPEPAVIIGADLVEHGKPSPEPYLKAAAELGVDPAECLVLEDADAGVQAGLAAGCRVIVVGALDITVTECLVRVRDMRDLRVDVDGEWLVIDRA